MLLLSESSISTARKSVSPRLQSATCLRSLPSYGCTSSFLTARAGAPFLPAAVTVTVTALGSGGALRAAKGVKADAANPASNRAPWKCIFLFISKTPFAQTILITTYGRRNTAPPEKLQAVGAMRVMTPAFCPNPFGQPRSIYRSDPAAATDDFL